MPSCGQEVLPADRNCVKRYALCGACLIPNPCGRVEYYPTTAAIPVYLRTERWSMTRLPEGSNEQYKLLKKTPSLLLIQAVPLTKRLWHALVARHVIPVINLDAAVTLITHKQFTKLAIMRSNYACIRSICEPFCLAETSYNHEFIKRYIFHDQEE